MPLKWPCPPAWNPGSKPLICLLVPRWQLPPKEMRHRSSHLQLYIRWYPKVFANVQKKNKKTGNCCFAVFSIPNSPITDNVKSIYGLLFRLLTSMVTFLASEAAYAINKPVRNWELMRTIGLDICRNQRSL